MGDDAQQSIAGGMPQTVVDVLETIQIDHQQRDRAGRSRALERGIDRLSQMTAIAQTGQRVLQGDIQDKGIGRRAVHR